MPIDRSWRNYPNTYRSREMKLIVDWIIEGVSGSVVGLPGVGKSNFLGFLCHRPDVIEALATSHKIKVALVPVDLNNLPDDEISTFYRVILRSFYEIRQQFDQTSSKVIVSIYREHKAIQDPFLVQSALRELLAKLREQELRIGFVFDRFDDFCEIAKPQMTAALRGFRDSFKDMIFYFMGMRQEASYLSDPSTLGELYEILDTHVCWVRPMAREDSKLLIEQETQLAPARPTTIEVETILELTGGFPSLLKATCVWWSTLRDRPSPEKWPSLLLANPSVEYRLREILTGLNQEELLILSEVEKLSNQHNQTDSLEKLAQQNKQVLDHLTTKGICQSSKPGWRIVSKLLGMHVARAKGRGKGRLWWDEHTRGAYQGQILLQDLTSLERDVLHFLLRYPRMRHTKTDLIVNAWPDELRMKGVTDDSLYQVIAGLRKKIEPIPAKPCYILNWRGKPEGGYQLFPEGRPN